MIVQIDWQEIVLVVAVYFVRRKVSTCTVIKLTRSLYLCNQRGDWSRFDTVAPAVVSRWSDTFTTPDTPIAFRWHAACFTLTFIHNAGHDAAPNYLKTWLATRINHSLEVVSRYRDPQLQVSKKYLNIHNLKKTYGNQANLMLICLWIYLSWRIKLQARHYVPPWVLC